MSTPIKVAITGAGGQIGYALIFRIASGGLFGPDQRVSLGLLEITPALPAMTGLIMELQDCAFPLLADVKATDKAEGRLRRGRLGLPRRRPAPEGRDDSRRTSSGANGPIFTGQGKAINDAAGPDVRILTVANPCNNERPDRQEPCPQDSSRAMVRNDPARPESGGLSACDQGGGLRRRGLEDGDLGEPLRHPVSPTTRTP